jgi:hypothetical protein
MLTSEANMQLSKKSAKKLSFKIEIINSMIDKFEVSGKEINIIAKEIRS